MRRHGTAEIGDQLRPDIPPGTHLVNIADALPVRRPVILRLTPVGVGGVGLFDRFVDRRADRLLRLVHLLVEIPLARYAQSARDKTGGGEPEPGSLFLPDFRLADRLGQQGTGDLRIPHRLHRQSVGGAEGDQIFIEHRAQSTIRRCATAEAVDPIDVDLQILLQVFLERRQAERAAQGDDALDARIAMDRAVETDGPLDFGDEVGEHRSHRLEYLPLIFTGGGVALEFLGLGEIKLKTLGERFGEIISTDGDGAKPDGLSVGDDQVGVFRAAVDDHRRTIVQALVVLHAVVDGQRAHLHDLHVHFHIGELLDVGIHQFLAHREDTDFNIRRLGILEKLIAPLDIFQRKGDLLNRFKLHDFRDFFRFHRRQFNEAGKAGLPAGADADDAAFGRMPLRKSG